MSATTRRWVGVVASALSVLLIASGAVVAVRLGNDEGRRVSDSDAQRLFAASQRETARVATVQSTMTITVSGHGQKITEEGHGVFSVEPTRARFTLALPEGAGTLVSLAYGSTVYLRLSGHTFPGGQHWAALELSKAAASNLNNDPRTMLQFIAGATHVRELGHEQVDGVQTVHYRATVDPELAYQRTPSELRLVDPNVVGDVHIDPFPMDIYLDGTGSVRRSTTHVEYQGITTEVDVRMTSADKTVLVRRPPTSDVVREANVGAVLRELGFPVPTGSEPTRG